MQLFTRFLQPRKEHTHSSFTHSVLMAIFPGEPGLEKNTDKQ